MNKNKPLRCPYCGSQAVLRSAEGIYKYNGAGAMLYVCSKYPACDSYVRVIPGTKIPAGSLANKALRALRCEAHRYFDLLFQTGIMNRNEAYEWLACMLQMPLSQAHIGNLSEYYCQCVIDQSKRLIENRKALNECWREQEYQQKAAGGGL